MEHKLLIIYYHEIVKNGNGFSYQKIEIEKFEDQMKFLKENRYNTLFFSELSAGLPERALIVSFDDGFRTVYENAAPIMKKYGIKGNVYLPTGYIDKEKQFMTWNMLKELYANRQFEMQAHTNSHLDIRTLGRKEMAEEIRNSNEIFQKELNYIPEAFCIPFGTYDRKSLALLKELGKYKYILGSHYGRQREARLESGVLARIGISNDDDMEAFQKKLLGKYDWKGPLQRLRLNLKNMRKERIIEYQY